MKVKYIFVYSLFLIFAFGCATYAPQYKIVEGQSALSRKQKKATSFYFIGDAGGAEINGSTDALQALKKMLDTVGSTKDYTVFLGDNIYDAGLPDEEAKTRKDAEHKLQAQVDVVTNFDGNVVFIPGNHDWYGDGLKGLKR
ncbi:MAG: putative MPP superfamily phosphohydrolase, partial [Dokdonia sp.]